MTSAPNLLQRGLRADFSSRLRRIVGDDNFLEAAPLGTPSSIEGDPQDSSSLSSLASARVAPRDADEVAAVLRVCTEERVTVVPGGSGLHQQIGLMAQPPLVALSMLRFKETEHYDPGDLTVGLGAGTTLGEVDALIAPHRQWLPVLAFPGHTHLGASTIGGMLATAIHGPLKQLFGGVREFCIGVRFVTGDGKHGKGGGRVVKNVAGYDLMKLLIGSYGTLGVITSASFKLFPRPQQTVTFICRFSSVQDAIGFRDRVISSPLAPLTLEIVSPDAARLLHEESAADVPWRVLARAAGSDRQLARYRAELGSAISAEITDEEEAGAWTRIEDFETRLPGAAVVLAVGCPISDVAQTLAVAERAARDRGLQFACIGRAGVGSLLVALLGASGTQMVNAVHTIRAALPPRVVVTVRRCPEGLKNTISLWQVRSEELEIMRTLKNALDPAWILNRGRYFV
ncbi:MAG TPA: FAD-binding oxidoreductase [Terriglobales bacterium]|nr:FAD-binding oxidoreductase [Terriglobales bacterium]